MYATEMKSKRGRRANEVRRLTDSLIVARCWKEAPIHPNAAAPNPLNPAPLYTASSSLYRLGTMPHSYTLQY